MNLVHTRSYEKINEHLNKTRRFYVFYMKDKNINLFPNLKFSFQK